MKPAPRVSVIIIFLNEARFLGEAIESVRAQSFTDWELILVDDGSTDGSSDIARAASDSERIRIIDHPGHSNRGMSASRNAGIAVSRGEFIAFLDADDVWSPDKLAEQLAIFDADPAIDMVYGRALIWHEWEDGATTRDYHFPLGVEPGRMYPPGSLLPMLIRNKVQTPTPVASMLRRGLVERVGGFEDRFRGMFEDQVFFAKTHIISHCHIDGRSWAKYRQHDDSCTAQASGRMHDIRARARLLRWLHRHLRRQKVKDAAVRGALTLAWIDVAEQIARLAARKLLRRA